VLALAGLRDDYQHDGRVLIEVLHDEALPDSLNDHEGTLTRLAEAYKQINAPKGEFGRKTLDLSTIGVSGADATHSMVDMRINDLTNRRNAIAEEMIEMLEGAAFRNQAIDEDEAERLIDRANDLLSSVH